MDAPTLFHLHFNTPNVEQAGDTLGRLGLELQRRFGTVSGDGVALAPAESTPEGFRFRLQTHQVGAVSVTLAPGRRPRFDHLGLISDGVEAVLERAAARDGPVRRSERRTFVTTPWGFRVELHPPGAPVVAALGPRDEARLGDVALRVRDVQSVRREFGRVVGDVPGLRIEPGDGPWVDSFEVVTPGGTETVDAAALLDCRERSG